MSGIAGAIETAPPVTDAPLTPTEVLRDLRAWLKFKLEYGPVKYQAPDDAGGPYNQYPHGYAAVLFPDWDVRKKLDLINETLLLEGK